MAACAAAKQEKAIGDLKDLRDTVEDACRHPKPSEKHLLQKWLQK